MADSPTGEKTEEPSSKKLRDARKKGDVAQSKETTSIAIFIILTSSCIWLIPAMFQEISDLLLISIYNISNPSMRAYSEPVTGAISVLIKILLPPLACVYFVVVLVKFLEVGAVFSTEPLKLDLSKLAFKGAKNVFSKKNLMTWLLSVLKLIIYFSVAFWVVYSHFYEIVQSEQCSIECTLTLWGRIVAIMFFYIGLTGVILAGVDIAIQHISHKKKLMMSLYDLKQEHKESQGNPEIKGARSALHMEILNSPIKENVKKSTVVIANPTHVAIGLEYELGQETLPKVSLMEVDNNALLSRRIAYLNNIPVIEDPPLARALLAKAKMNQYIPEEFIDPVVVIMRWVYGLNDQKMDNDRVSYDQNSDHNSD